MKIVNLPFVKIVKAAYGIGVPLSIIISYFVFYWAWEDFSPAITLTIAIIIMVVLTYNIALNEQYFVFEHIKNYFTFKKIIFRRSIEINRIRKLEIYYPGPTTPEKFNKKDIEFKWFGKRDPSAVKMIFYLSDGTKVKVGRTYIPIAEYIRKYLLTQGVICVERYLSSLEPERYIDVVYKPSVNIDNTRTQNNFSKDVPPPPWLKENGEKNKNG